MKKYLKSINANIMLNAAEELGLKINIIDSEFSYAEILHTNKSLKLLRNITSFNDTVAYHIAKNKYLSNLILRKNEIPTPTSLRYVINNADLTFLASEIFKASKQFTKFVLKANSLSTGQGVFIGLSTENEIYNALIEINKLKVESVIIEDFVSGKEYRIIVFEDNIIDIIERIPANITGDGKSTIEELINIKNSQRTMIDMPKINIDSEIIKNLSIENVNINSVLEENKNIRLRKVCNFVKGGEVNRIQSSQVDTKYKDIFLKARIRSGLNYIGIDLICNDLYAYENDGAINEVNCDPMIDLHYFASLSAGTDPLDIPKQLIKLYFNI